MYLAFTIVVVSSESGTFIIEKSSPSLAEIGYVDVSGWDAKEWANHLELQRDLVATGHGDIIKNSLGAELFENVLKSVQDGIQQQ